MSVGMRILLIKLIRLTKISMSRQVSSDNSLFNKRPRLLSSRRMHRGHIDYYFNKSLVRGPYGCTRNLYCVLIMDATFISSGWIEHSTMIDVGRYLLIPTNCKLLLESVFFSESLLAGTDEVPTFTPL